MTKKIFRSIFLVVAVTLFACFLITTGTLYEYFSSLQSERLNAQATLIAKGVEAAGESYLSELSISGYRSTLVAADGTVLYDTEANAAEMENHAQREEIQEAAAEGIGESSRYSVTLSQKTLYRAIRLSDGTILRVSVTYDTILRLLFRMLNPVVVIFIIAALLSLLFARRLAKRIVKPMNMLDLDEPLENDAYEELSPLLTRIEKQRRQIDEQLREMQRSQQEFSAVTENMNEGLILLNNKCTILSINRAALRIFDTEQSCVGQSILTIGRSLEMQRLLDTALSGSHGEAELEIGKSMYQLDASPVFTGDTLTGIAIFAFDITEKSFAEQQRREFSANVSHELKTPLQTIMGSAELLENGMVKTEDIPRFIGHIHSEASRLVTLINDIIRLSQLDERISMQHEETDLYALASEVISDLTASAAEYEVTLSLHGESTTVDGVQRLLYELIYNLCDNAIKYNKKNGSVDITVQKKNNHPTIVVSDTGIGIPQGERERIFERFYRVDKSHSKQTGGTGLGLSIVKHTAQYHNAEVKLESTPEKGTTITIIFP